MAPRKRAVAPLCAAAVLLAAPALGQTASRAAPANAPGATLQELLAAGRQLSPSLRAAALESEAAAAKASGAGALDDPALTDSYTYYKDPGVFSAHAVMVTQAFPLWGKRSLRREAALADVDASRGREQAARDELDEKVKVAFAQHAALSRSGGVDQAIQRLAGRLRAAAAARYGQGGGDQAEAIRAMGEETTAKLELAKLDGEREATRARLNALVGRPGDAPVAASWPRGQPGAVPPLATLLDRARAANPALSAQAAEVAAARTRGTLADKAWYPDISVGAGPLVQTNNRPVGFTATVGLNMPVPWGRTGSGQREAAARLGASQLRHDAAVLEVEGALGEALARLAATRRTQALLRREGVPQAQAAFQAAVAGYGQGRGDLGGAIEAERRIHDTELALLQAELDEQVAVAGIERLIGGAL